MIRPFVIRIMKNKGGPELVKLFEQLRKNIKLNRSWDRREAGIKSAKTKELRKDFYDGLIYDLMENESYTLSEIVMAEKMKDSSELSKLLWSLTLRWERSLTARTKLGSNVAKTSQFLDWLV